MTQPEDEVLTPGTALKAPYHTIHLDESERPTKTTQRVQNSFQYTVRDVRMRIDQTLGSSSGSCTTVQKSIAEFPSKCINYTQDTFAFYKENPATFRKEVLSGLTVALLQVPESVAFSYVAGLNSSFGLYATVFMGSLTALFGGKPGMISGAAGALAVVQATMMSNEGPLADLSIDERTEHLLMSLIFVGIFQILFGLSGFSKFVTLIPQTAMIGFLNGLAIIIFLAQLSTFKKCTVEGLKFEECRNHEGDTIVWMSAEDGETWMVLALVVITMLIMHFFPKVPRFGAIIPASLVAILVGTGVEHGIYRPFILENGTRTVADAAPIKADFPTPLLPSLGDSANWGVVMEFAATLAAIGLFESIMTLQAVNEITKTPVTTKNCNKESIAQGIGNLVSGFFRAMGGDAMIGQSTINVLNGARYRLSGFTAGVFMLIIVNFASPLIELYLVDVVAIIMVTVLAVTVNLAIAVIAGIVWQSLVNVWQNTKLLVCDTSFEPRKSQPALVRSPTAKDSLSGDDEQAESDPQSLTKVYRFRGPITFGSTRAFRQYFTIDNDPHTIIVDLQDALVCDFSVIVTIRDLASRYRDSGKRMVLRHVCHRSQQQFHRDRDWVLSEHGKSGDAHVEGVSGLDVFHVDEPPLSTDGLNPEEMLDEVISSGQIQADHEKYA